jgi:membrane-associated HD superfamily phosphohydrolase
MDSESEVPPPSLYANSQSKERTILLKKMAQKQKNKEANNKKSKSVPPPLKFDEKSIDALKKELGATCDCVAEISLTIESIGERIKTDIGALKNEFDSKLVVINETINKQAQTQLNMEVAITELYKKVHFIEQILITSEDRNNLELELIASTSIKDEMITQNMEAITTNLPILIPPDNLEQVPPSTLQIGDGPPHPPHPQSITVDDVEPKIDNNLVVLDTGSAQSAGSSSFKIIYDI